MIDFSNLDFFRVELGYCYKLYCQDKLFGLIGVRWFKVLSI